MKRKKFYSIILAAFLLCPAVLSKDLNVSSVWTPIPLEIDGKSTDWAGDVLNTEERLSLDLGFRNDNDFLYILFKFKDPKYLSSIGETGLTVYFNTEGKKKKEYGIKFIRQQVPAEAFIKILEGQRGALTEEQKQEVRSRETYSIRLYKILEKGKELDIPRDIEQTHSASFRVAQESQAAVYELAIPLEKSAGKPTGIGAEPGKRIKIGFEWGGLTPERRAMLMNRVGDQSAAAGAGGATGDLTQERNVSDGGADISSIGRMAPKKYSLWMDLELAKQ